MSPYRIDQEIDYIRLRQLSEEFTALWERLQSFYLDAAAGFAYVYECVEEEQKQIEKYMKGSELDSGRFQDALTFSYDRIFAGEFCTSAIHKATQGEVKARNSPGGANFITLGQLCLVSFYDYWNDYLRKEYVVAKGRLDPQENKKEVIDKALKE
ncbi:MAG: hypothetical protein ACLFPI_10830 [Desulfobacterales bacterium]